MSADGKYVAFATVARVGIASSTLYLLDAATGALLASRTLKVGELPSPAGAIPPTTAETDAREVRFSPDGRYLAVGTSEGRGYLFASEGLTPLVAVQTGGQLRAIAYRDDAIYLGAGDGLLQRIPLDGGAAWQGYTTAWPYNEPKVSPEGSQVVVGAKSGGFVVLDAQTGACVFSANFGTVRDAFFTPDGAYLVAATGAFSAGTIVYRTADWSFAFSGSMAAAASVTADSRYLLMADGKAMLFDLTSGQRVATLDPGFAANANYFKTAYVSKDASRVVVARRDLTPGEVAIAFFRRR
jgi:WD40 repeat protein